MMMIVGKVMTNRSNTLIFYPIWDSLLIVVWTQSGRLSITATLTFHHQPTRNSIFTGPNSIHLICIFVPPLCFLSIFIHALSSLSHDRTLTPSLFAFLISLLFFLTPYLRSPFCCCGTLSWPTLVQVTLIIVLLSLPLCLSSRVPNLVVISSFCISGHL